MTTTKQNTTTAKLRDITEHMEVACQIMWLLAHNTRVASRSLRTFANRSGPDRA